MCSIGEDDFGDEGGLHAMVKDEQLSDAKTNFGDCSKCGTKGILIKLNFRDAECKECFLAYVRHKFRATLGSSKILPKGAEVLLVFDGSAESLVLLDMMQYSQTQNTHKRLHVNTKILFIDESSINKAVNIRDLQTLLSRYIFEAYVMSVTNRESLCKLKELDSYLDTNWDKNNFVASMERIKTLTSRQDFLKTWKSQLIEAAATQLKCNFVFSPDISTNLASDLLNSISLGRGGSAALDIALLDDRLGNLKIVRPLRNLNANEVNFYLQVNDLSAIKLQSYGEAHGPSASIQNLTKRFVDDLQGNFSSTISTVFRTGDKIAPIVPSSVDEISKCGFCKSQIDVTPSTTILAIEFSRLASALSGNLDNCEEQVKVNGTLHADSPSGNLCHACANIKKDCENIDLLR